MVPGPRSPQSRRHARHRCGIALCRPTQMPADSRSFRNRHHGRSGSASAPIDEIVVTRTTRDRGDGRGCFQATLWITPVQNLALDRGCHVTGIHLCIGRGARRRNTQATRNRIHGSTSRRKFAVAQRSKLCAPRPQHRVAALVLNNQRSLCGVALPTRHGTAECRGQRTDADSKSAGYLPAQESAC